MLQPVSLATAVLTAASLTVLLPSTQARAASLFTGSSGGEFGSPLVDPLIDPDATFSVESAGPAGETFSLGEPGSGSMPNQLTFKGESFTTALEQPFSLGRLTYLNGQTFSGTNVSSVPINISLSLAQPAPVQLQFGYSFGFDLTPNTVSADSADRLEISENPAPQTFDTGGMTYQLALLGFSQDSGQTFEQSFQVAEDELTDSTLFAKVRLASSNGEDEQPTGIPEPALVSGLLLLGGSIFLNGRRQ